MSFKNRILRIIESRAFLDAIAVMIVSLIIVFILELLYFRNQSRLYFERVTLYFYTFLPLYTIVFIASQIRTKRSSRTTGERSLRSYLLMAFSMLAILPSLPVFIISSDIIQRGIEEYLAIDVQSLKQIPATALSLRLRPEAEQLLKLERDKPPCVKYTNTCEAIQLGRDGRILHSTSAESKNLYEYYRKFTRRNARTNKAYTIDFFEVLNQSPSPFYAAIRVHDRYDKVYFFKLTTAEKDLFHKTEKILEQFHFVSAYTNPIRFAIDILLGILLFFILASTIALAFLLSKNISFPIMRVSDAAQLVKKDSLGEVKSILSDLLEQQKKGPLEIRTLAASMLSMVEELEKFRIEERERQKSAAWEEVARQVAHEIKNPLTPMKLSAERILKQLQKYPNEVPVKYQEVLQQTSSAILRQIEIIRNLVDSFRQMGSMPEKNFGQVDIKNLLAELQRENTAENIPIFLETHGTPLKIQADRELLRRALLNLIQNAREALEQVGIAEPKITLRLLFHAESLEIHVEDNGPGIVSSVSSKIFQAGTTTKKDGEGIGLWIAKRIVEEHHGKIEVDSFRKKAESYTRFKITFKVP